MSKQPYKWLLPLVYKNTRVILLSWHLYEDVSSVVKREQVLICPNGIPEMLVKTSISKRNNLKLRLLFLSNLIESKGVYVLLDACKILKDKGYKFVCNFIGGESKEINRLVFEAALKERGLNECVVYHGPKYGSEKEEFWKATDVFVQPTYEDCFPLTILEAMQHGKPVVSTDEGAILDLVIDGKNGLVCKRKDVDSLAVALEKLFNDKKLREDMGVNGYQIYMNKFTLEAFEKNMNDILQSVITENNH